MATVSFWWDTLKLKWTRCAFSISLCCCRRRHRHLFAFTGSVQRAKVIKYKKTGTNQIESEKKIKQLDAKEKFNTFFFSLFGKFRAINLLGEHLKCGDYVWLVGFECGPGGNERELNLHGYKVSTIIIDEERKENGKK